MNFSTLDPRQVRDELIDWQHRLEAGWRTLGEVGEVDVGTAPRDAIWRDDRVTLYRYRSARRASKLPPLLICYALVNRPYMVDLQPDRSLVRGLLAQGLDVYLVDWGYPDAADRHLDFDDYVNGYLHDAVQAACRDRGVTQLNLLGICQGGVLALTYAALHPERIARLVTMVTPVDFAVPENRLAQLAKKVDVDALVDTLGTVPGELLSLGYLALQPFQQLARKYLGLPELLRDREQLLAFARMEKWIYDSPAQAGEMFRQFVRQCFQENRLVSNTLEVGGRRVDFRRVAMPVLNVYATRDHLVPPSSARALKRCVGTRDYTELPLDGGHIGIYVGRRAAQVPVSVAAWLRGEVLTATRQEA